MITDWCVRCMRSVGCEKFVEEVFGVNGVLRKSNADVAESLIDGILQRVKSFVPLKDEFKADWVCLNFRIRS